MIWVGAEAIAFGQVEPLVAAPAHGAVASFYGVVRDHSASGLVLALEYEAYAAMAERVLEQIVQEARARWPVGRVAVLHRVGELAVGEISVAIGVGSAHRGEAFAACAFLIDQIKLRAPIWKREVGEGGASWVQGAGWNAQI